MSTVRAEYSVIQKPLCEHKFVSHGEFTYGYNL